MGTLPEGIDELLGVWGDSEALGRRDARFVGPKGAGSMGSLHPRGI